MDFRALDEGKDNWTTARELGQLLRAIFRREILTPEACDEMIQLLERSSRNRIANGVPRDIPVGHKSGYFPGLRHDAGWVRVPGHPYILSVFLENVGKDEGGLAALDAVGRIVYDVLGPTDE
jgi:beta-lactamase class A